MRIVTTARRLGPLICTYFLSFAAAEPTEKKKKKKASGREKEKRTSREWHMNYSTGSSRLPRR